MLILVYLVCMLSQTDSVSSSDISGVYPIENSQKLMLTIPTDIPTNTLSDFDSNYSTTEALTTEIDNSISRNDNIYIGTHPLFPLQEPTTTPMPHLVPIRLEKEILPGLTIATDPVQESTTEEELALPATTEEIITEDNDHTNYHQEISSTEAIISIENPKMTEPDISVSATPIKRSLSLDELDKFKATSIETTTESQLEISTPPISFEEPTESNQLSTNLLTSADPQDDQDDSYSSTAPTFSVLPPVSEDDLSTNLLTSADSQDDLHSTTVPAFTISPPVSEDDLFLDNWANHISAENKDINLGFKDDISNLNFMEEPTKNLFENEDFEFAPIESPILKNESNDSALLEQQVNNDMENTSHLRHSDTEQSYPFFSPQNLMNLFTFDHQPSSSNLKTNWWPNSKSSSMAILAESAAKSQMKRENSISPNDDSQEMSDGNQRVFRRGFDNLLNRKLKNSVSILEKLFGNYFLQ